MGTIGGIPVHCPYPDPKLQNNTSQPAQIHPPQQVSNPPYNSTFPLSNLNNITVSAQSQIIERDPITSGIQSRPGVVRPVNAPQVVGQTGVRPIVVNGNVRPTYR